MSELGPWEESAWPAAGYTAIPISEPFPACWNGWLKGGVDAGGCDEMTSAGVTSAGVLGFGFWALGFGLWAWALTWTSLGSLRSWSTLPPY